MLNSLHLLLSSFRSKLSLLLLFIVLGFSSFAIGQGGGTTTFMYSPSSISGSRYTSITPANPSPRPSGATSYEITPTLTGTGLNIMPTDGMIYGTPTSIISSSYTVTAYNGSTVIGTSTIIISITAESGNSSSTTTFSYNRTPITGTTNTAILTASPMSPPAGANYYEVSNTSSPLPMGLSISTSTGSITGTPTMVSYASVTISAYSSSVTSTANLVGTANISFSITSGSSSSTTTFSYNRTPITGTTNTAILTASPMSPPAGANYYEVSNTSSPLPMGLSISTSTGSITGTPTMVSYASVTISAYSSSVTSTANLVGTANISFSITSGSSSSTTTFSYNRTPITGTTNTAILTASPMSPPAGANYYEVSNTSSPLPMGLSISTSTGSITGTPTMVSYASVTISAYSSSVTSTANLVGTANISFSITSGSSSSTTTFSYNRTPITGTTNTAILTASPMSPPAGANYYEVSNTSSPLPMGLSISTSTGSITGTPTMVSYASVTISAYSSSVTSTANLVGTANISFSITSGSSSSTTTFSYNRTPITGTTNTAILTASPMSPPAGANYYEVSNTSSPLPMGLSISTSTGSITGTPTMVSYASVTISAYSSSVTSTANLVGTANISFSITSGSSSSTTTFSYNRTPITGTTNTAILTASPMSPPAGANYYEVSNTSSPLPMGLSISTSTGSITGTPTMVSYASVTISAYSSSVTSTANLVGTANISFSITSGSSSSTTTSFSYNNNNGFVGYSFSSNPSISPVFANSFVLTSGTLPSGLTFNPSDGLISGTPTSANSSTITITGYNGATLYGTATITFSIVRKTYYSIANGSWSTSSTWSLSSGGLAEQSGLPGVSDNVVIERNNSVTIGVSTNTGVNNVIIKDGSTLSVSGSINANAGVIVNPGATLLGNSTNVTGTVTLQQNIQGQRGWKLFANPFATSQNTLVNSGLNVTSSTPNDVKIWSNVSNSWSSAGSSFSSVNIPANAAYAAFIRGSSSDNFNGLTYTNGPSAFVYSVSGTINPASINISPVANNWILVGNPFAAPVNTQALTGGTSKPYYIYKISQTGTPTNMPSAKSGEWIPFASSNTTATIPVLGVLCYMPASSSPFNISTSDINTSGTPQTGLFATEPTLQLMEITLNNDQQIADRLFIRSNFNSSNNGNDELDLPKFQNETSNFYSVSPDKTQLAVDTRKEWNQTVPLGLKTPPGNYNISIQNNTLSVGKSIYLKDNYLNNTALLKAGTVYNFSVSNDSLSQGDKRFELQFGLASNSLPTDESIINGGLRLKVIGTVLQGNLLTIEVGGIKVNEVGLLSLIDMNGRIVKNTSVVNGVNKISVNELSNGLQLIKLSNGKNQLVKKFIKD
jgi:hypothetical protein